MRKTRGCWNEEKAAQTDAWCGRAWIEGMLILDLGIWIVPFTLFIAPCRKFTSFVARIQQLFRDTTLLDVVPNFWRYLASSHFWFLLREGTELVACGKNSLACFLIIKSCRFPNLPEASYLAKTEKSQVSDISYYYLFCPVLLQVRSPKACGYFFFLENHMYIDQKSRDRAVTSEM